MGIVSSAISNKGGVGKTTTMVNLASAIATLDPSKKVLLLDADGQGNSAIAFRINPHDHNQVKYTLIDCLLDGVDPSKAIIKLDDRNSLKIPENLFLLPANYELNLIGFEVLNKWDEFPKPFELLKKLVDELRNDFDYIFIDAPPTMDLMACNILSASDNIYIPFVPDLFSTQGLIRVVNEINDFKERNAVDVKIAGVIKTMVEANTTTHSSVSIQADAFCLKNNIPMMKRTIPKRAENSKSFLKYGVPIVIANKNHEASKYYFELAQEVLEQND
ncbi:ParA family protein [Hazenella sp. IB182357]|uniref:ParA family protein n=1 Tax=Polycladospora coralii TaxID=2771432 RepID=A0A926RUG0_9BACL|nr:ParA family protein [Polycladospora coralii]